MKSFRRCISDILLMTGWTLTVFSIARMSTFAAILMKWKECSNQYYTQEVPNIINKNSFDWSEETRDAVWFSQASEKIVMHDVIRSVGGPPCLSIEEAADPLFGIGVLCLIVYVLVGRSLNRKDCAESDAGVYRAYKGRQNSSVWICRGNCSRGGLRGRSHTQALRTSNKSAATSRGFRSDSCSN